MSNNSDQEIIGFLIKVSRTLFWGLLWIFANAIAGIYFKMAFVNKHTPVLNIIFYSAMMLTLFLLIRYYYYQWRNEQV